MKLGSHVNYVGRSVEVFPNIFQNDLSHCVTTNLSMYADDHQIYHTVRDQASVTSKLIRDSTRTATKLSQLCLCAHKQPFGSHLDVVLCENLEIKNTRLKKDAS